MFAPGWAKFRLKLKTWMKFWTTLVYDGKNMKLVISIAAEMYIIHLLTNCFCRMCIFSNHSKWCLEVMVYLMHILIQSFVMHESVDPVMPRILNHRTDKYLQHQFTE